jgi:hypothetical protein
MKEFIRKHDNRVHRACFDRMLFRGYLPIMSGWAMLCPRSTPLGEHSHQREVAEDAMPSL